LTVPPSTTSNRNDYTVPRCRLSLYQSSFIPSVINLWNSLDNDTRNTRTSDSFKINLKSKVVLAKIPQCSHFCFEQGNWLISNSSTKSSRQDKHMCFGKAMMVFIFKSIFRTTFFWLLIIDWSHSQQFFNYINLKSKVVLAKIPTHFLVGDRQHNILYARLCRSCSSLKYDLFRSNIITGSLECYIPSNKTETF
jgi:hypothetical protein